MLPGFLPLGLSLVLFMLACVKLHRGPSSLQSSGLLLLLMHPTPPPGRSGGQMNRGDKRLECGSFRSSTDQVGLSKTKANRREGWKPGISMETERRKSQAQQPPTPALAVASACQHCTQLDAQHCLPPCTLSRGVPGQGGLGGQPSVGTASC